MSTGNGGGPRTRPMRHEDLEAARTLYRAAFGNFVGRSAGQVGTSDYASARFLGHPEGAICAEADGVLVGFSLATRWGSLAQLGPTVVDPSGFHASAGHRALRHTLEVARGWGCRVMAGFTFSDSPGHLDFFRRNAIQPGPLTLLMTLGLPRAEGTGAAVGAGDGSRLGLLPPGQQEDALRQADALTDSLFPGLSLAREMAHVREHGLGETVLLFEGSRLEGLAVLHAGPGSEADAGCVESKFAFVRPGSGSDTRWDRLLSAAEDFGTGIGAKRLTVGTSLVDSRGYRLLTSRGYVAGFAGVSLFLDGDPGYKTAAHALSFEDWR